MAKAERAGFGLLEEWRLLTGAAIAWLPLRVTLPTGSLDRIRGLRVLSLDRATSASKGLWNAGRLRAGAQALRAAVELAD